jgi:peroxiredoxin
MTFRWLRRLFVLSACLVFSQLSGLAVAAEPIPVDWQHTVDAEGQALSTVDAEWRVVLFLGAECPLARLYGARVSRLSGEYASKGVSFVGVDSNPQDSEEDIRRYARDLDIDFPIVKDRDQSLAKAFGATRTAEVMVLDRTNRVRYQGRVDDQYEPGITRAEPKKNELTDALDALLAGQEPAVTSTPPVGCLITILKTPPKPLKNTGPVTFASDVAPVLNRHCVECHRSGEIAPFSLTEYDEVVGWGEMMLEVIDQGRMPPWHADPKYGKFVGSRQMSQADHQVLIDWVAQGMPEGDRAKLPALPQLTAGWQLPALPDEQFVMRGRPFVVPADGIVEYQYFVVDPGWKDDRWVRAAQVVPGNSSVVHHCIVFVRSPDGSDSHGIGWLGGYVPGQRVIPLPDGYARRVPAGSKLVFQMHYTPNGREVNDLSKLGVWFAKADEVTHEVTTRVALNHDFEIPPGVKDHTVRISMDRFARDSQLLSVMPHMHLRGKSFRLSLQQQTENEKLLFVPNYDFNWQHWYHFETPLSLAEVPSLEMKIQFDNSRDNPTNPDPREYVTWGDQTFEEMAVAFFEMAHPRDQPRRWNDQSSMETAKQTQARLAKIAAEADRFMRDLDKDGDGIVQREEVPDSFRLFGFRQVDFNNDGRIVRDEAEGAAAARH